MTKYALEEFGRDTVSKIYFRFAASGAKRQD
jgi:hypothetical protein